MKLLITFLIAGLLALFSAPAKAQQSAADRYNAPTSTPNFADDDYDPSAKAQPNVLDKFASQGKEYADDENFDEAEEDDIDEATKSLLEKNMGRGSVPSKGSSLNKTTPKKSSTIKPITDDEDENDAHVEPAPAKKAPAKKTTAKKGKRKNTKRLLPQREHEYVFRTSQNNQYLFKKETQDAAILNRQDAKRSKQSGSKKVTTKQQQLRDQYVVDLSSNAKPFVEYKLTEEGTIYRGKAIDPLTEKNEKGSKNK